MKKFIVALVLLVGVLMPASAQAAPAKFQGAPLTNLDSPASIRVSFSDFPTKGGLYIMQCAEALAGARPTLCNNAVQLWIANAPGASFTPTADIVFKPTVNFSSSGSNVDCTTTKCGIFLRYDHTVAADLTQDQFIVLSFKASASTAPALASDVISATINGVALSSKVPFRLGYRQFAVLDAKSAAGATLSYQSLAPACALKSLNDGFEIVALKGTGFCNISVTSAGNSIASAVTAQFPIELTLGIQTIGDFAVPKSIKAGQKIELPILSNFGEKLSYKTSSTCSVSKGVLSVKKGKCKITVSAKAKAQNYRALTLNLAVKGN